MTSDLITITQAVAETGRTRSTIYEWIKSGRLPVAVDVPHRRRLRRADVLKAARIQPAKAEPAA